MIIVKKEHFAELKEFGFYDTGTCFALDPAVEHSGHPLASLFTALNVFVDKRTGKFWCGFATENVERIFNELKNANLLEEVLK